MRRSLTAALLATVLCPLWGRAEASAQVLEETMVPPGRVRIQLAGTFDAWDTRFGRTADGVEQAEALGDDLTDPTALSLFPGMPALTEAIRNVTGLTGYQPVLGATDGRVTQDVTNIRYGIDIGVFDWLTIGGVLPWGRDRTAVDFYFTPDTINGNLGVSPMISNPSGVDAFLASSAGAGMQAAAYAASACAGGPSATCTSAQSLAARTASLDAAMQGAYAATPFFPLTGTPSGDALALEASTLSADLVAAGLAGLSPLALATDVLTSEGMPLLPAVKGSGIQAAPLQTRKGLWGMGDVELTARIRLLDNITPEWSEESRYVTEDVLPHPGFGYRVTASFLARLPTGRPENPDILLDVGLADAQTDLEGGVNATFHFGRHLGLTAGGRYAVQGATTVVRRVALPELAMPPASTRRALTWSPGFYLQAGVAPTYRVNEALVLHAEYRFFHKGRDVYELVDPDASLDPFVLAVETGMKLHQLGGGLRYDTVAPWLGGAQATPMEVWVRLLHSFAGSGGQTPQATRVEGGLRLFKRFWGPSR